MMLDVEKLIENRRAAAAIYDGLNTKKHASRCINLQYWAASAAICLDLLSLALSSP